MTIYTSYFAKLRQIPDHIVPISICAKAPDCYKGLQYKKLAPKYSFLMKYKQDRNASAYIECFQKEILSLLNQEDVLSELMELSEEKDIVLLCFEKSQDFCHRHLVADWLNVNQQASVKEWGI